MDHSELENELKTYLMQALQLSVPPSIDDDLFDLGVKSIHVLEIMTMISSRSGKTLPLHQFKSTLRYLLEIANCAPEPAAASRSKTDTTRAEVDISLQLYKNWSPMSRCTHTWLNGFNVKAKGPALFWVCQGEHEFIALSAYLPKSQTIYGLRSASAVGSYDQPMIDLLAREYVEEITRIIPPGPIFVGGNCQSCLIAHAIAIQIKQKGWAVENLILAEWLGWSLPYSDKLSLLYGGQGEHKEFLHMDAEHVPALNLFEDYTIENIGNKKHKWFEHFHEKDLADYLVRVISDMKSNPEPRRIFGRIRRKLMWFNFKIYERLNLQRKQKIKSLIEHPKK